MTDYKNSGVNIEKGDLFVEKIIDRIGKHKNVLSNLTEFAALYDLSSLKLKKPVLVSGTDGVGTKLKIAFLLNKHDTIGIDLVAMCVNDVITTGALPLFFLDYFATGKLHLEIAESVIKGVVKGCELAGCTLVGGETAEMPGFYNNNEYDLAGFCVGAVEKNKIINGKKIKRGDMLIGIESSGFHSNGYSLIREVIKRNKLSLNEKIKELDITLCEALLKPTYIYSKLIQNLTKKYTLNGIAHITGGGIESNLSRIIPNKLCAQVDSSKWQKNIIFSYIQEKGKINIEEMYKVFNMGIGLIIVVKKTMVNQIIKQIQKNNFECYLIGEIKESENIEEKVILEHK